MPPWEPARSPKEEVGVRWFDPEPFQLGGDLTAVVGGVVDNVAQDRPPRQGESAADRAKHQHCVKPLRREGETQFLEAAIGTLQQPGRVVHRGQVGFGRDAVIRIVSQRAQVELGHQGETTQVSLLDVFLQLLLRQIAVVDHQLVHEWQFLPSPMQLQSGDGSGGHALDPANLSD
jgi:hypothetical protein